MHCELQVIFLQLDVTWPKVKFLHACTDIICSENREDSEKPAIRIHMAMSEINKSLRIFSYPLNLSYRECSGSVLECLT